MEDTRKKEENKERSENKKGENEGDEGEEEEEEEEEAVESKERLVQKRGLIITRIKIRGPPKKIRTRFKKPLPPRPQPRAPLKKTDLLIMWVLWSYEILHLITRAFKASWLAKQNYSTGARMGNVVEPETTESVSLMMATVAVTMAVSYLFSGEVRSTSLETSKSHDNPVSKGWALILGQIIYAAAPFIGLALLQEPDENLSAALLGCQIAWYAVLPIRFWLIFHQKLPCEVIFSRLTVAINLFIIGTVEYVVSMTIDPTTNLIAPSMVFSWVALILGMFLWTGAIAILLKLFNQVPDDTEAIKSCYNDTEVLRYFSQRQKISSILRFLALIYPSITFAMSKELMNGAINQYGNNESSISGYKLHLAITPLAVVATTVVWLFWNVIRQESRDLISIGLAHFLNLTFFVLILIIVNNDTDKVIDDNSTTKADIQRELTKENVGMALIMLRYRGPPGKVFNIAYNDSSGTWIDMPAMTGKPNILIAQMFPSAPTFRSYAQGSVNGNILFSDEITFTFQTVNTYIERNGRLHQLRYSGHSLTMDDVAYPQIGPAKELTLTSISIAPRCTEGPPSDANGFRFLLNDSNCHSMKSWIRFLDGDRNVLSQHSITPTAQDDGTFEPEDVKVSLTRSLSYTSLTWIVDNREDWALEIEEPVDPYIYQKYWVIDPEENFTHTFPLANVNDMQRGSSSYRKYKYQEDVVNYLLPSSTTE